MGFIIIFVITFHSNDKQQASEIVIHIILEKFIYKEGYYSTIYQIRRWEKGKKSEKQFACTCMPAFMLFAINVFPVIFFSKGENTHNISFLIDSIKPDISYIPSYLFAVIYSTALAVFNPLEVFC